jgi:hypothetical protein
MMREQDFFVIPGRLRRVRSKSGPMTGLEAKPKSQSQTNLGIPGSAHCAVPT